MVSIVGLTTCLMMVNWIVLGLLRPVYEHHGENDDNQLRCVQNPMFKHAHFMLNMLKSLVMVKKKCLKIRHVVLFSFSHVSHGFPQCHGWFSQMSHDCLQMFHVNEHDSEKHRCLVETYFPTQKITRVYVIFSGEYASTQPGTGQSDRHFHVQC